MKLWQKGFEISKEIENFTVGKDREMDLYLAPHDVIGSIAHITMLQSIGLLTQDELSTLKKELIALYYEIEKGNFVIEEGVEDVHSQVELHLTRKLGEVGKKIHSGRSRNDQVLLDLKLFIRKEIENTVHLVKELFDTLIELSEKHKHVLIPGYTHYQIAMPSSFGLWFGGYAESLVDDLITLQAAYRVANKNPLGSAAGYGSSFPLNRTMTTRLLGFEQLNVNVVYAQMGRGKTERIVAQAMANVAATLAKLAQDVCLYISQNFGFITFPDALTTGSSIMPHKKNPDVFELVRAKCNKIMALPNEISLITANLASGYHRDLQLIKENFIPAFAELNSCIYITNYAISQIIIKENILEDKRYEHLFSVEVVNDLVLKGVPFREAYRIVAEQIQNGTFNPPKEVKHTHEGSIGNLQNAIIQQEMQRVLESFPFEQVNNAINQLLQQ
ncbi:MAG: argininosuccinate lyase [Bacteroidia bacterium]|nr:argininosuccinate lyase [Bacteroidia bacterium]MDW8302695.1 argininosuccinate lyase [Bacteroidia bacterium]